MTPATWDDLARALDRHQSAVDAHVQEPVYSLAADRAQRERNGAGDDLAATVRAQLVDAGYMSLDNILKDAEFLLAVRALIDNVDPSLAGDRLYDTGQRFESAARVDRMLRERHLTVDTTPVQSHGAGPWMVCNRCQDLSTAYEDTSEWQCTGCGARVEGEDWGEMCIIGTAVTAPADPLDPAVRAHVDATEKTVDRRTST